MLSMGGTGKLSHADQSRLQLQKTSKDYIQSTRGKLLTYLVDDADYSKSYLQRKCQEELQQLMNIKQYGQARECGDPGLDLFLISNKTLRTNSPNMSYEIQDNHSPPAPQHSVPIYLSRKLSPSTHDFRGVATQRKASAHENSQDKQQQLNNTIHAYVNKNNRPKSALERGLRAQETVPRKGPIKVQFSFGRLGQVITQTTSRQQHRNSCFKQMQRIQRERARGKAGAGENQFSSMQINYY